MLRIQWKGPACQSSGAPILLTVGEATNLPGIVFRKVLHSLFNVLILMTTSCLCAVCCVPAFPGDRRKPKSRNFKFIHENSSFLRRLFSRKFDFHHEIPTQNLLPATFLLFLRPLTLFCTFPVCRARCWQSVECFFLPPVGRNLSVYSFPLTSLRKKGSGGGSDTHRVIV